MNEQNNKQYQEMVSDIVNQRNKMLNKQIEDQRLVGQIVNQKSEQFDAFLKKQKQEQTGVELSKEELQYRNSPYFHNYLNMLRTIDSIVVTLYNMLLLKYNENVKFYQRPFCRKVDATVLIRGIGHSIPENLLAEAVNIIKMKLCQISTLADTEFDVDIISTEYIQVGGIYKQNDSCFITVEAKKVEKRKTLI